MEMVVKGKQSSQDEADGNPQPFRVFDSITQRHRGGGQGLPPLRCTLPSNEGGRNAEDTSDYTANGRRDQKCLQHFVLLHLMATCSAEEAIPAHHRDVVA